jgi:hypothetical protein
MLQSREIQSDDFLILEVTQLAAVSYQNCCKFFLPQSETCELA